MLTKSPYMPAQECIPNELKRLPAWLMWRYEEQPGANKPRKVPYYINGRRRSGQQGCPEDRAKLSTFEEAVAAATRGSFDGVGFALMPDWGLTALDFDKCIAPDGSLPPEIRDIIANTYSEISPSGCGIRAVVRGNLGNHKSHANGDVFGFETFNTNGFVTVTGNLTDYCQIMGNEHKISDPNLSLIRLVEQRFASQPLTGEVAIGSDPADFMVGNEQRLGLSLEQMEAFLDTLDPNMGRDDWIKVGMALHHECEGDDTGFEFWDEWSSGGATYPGTEGLREQWDSFKASTPGKPMITMRSVIRMAKASGNVDTSLALGNLTELLKTGPSRPAQADHRFQILSTSAVASLPDPNWLIQGVLPEKSLAMIYGKSGAGKTFAVLDMAAHVALGKNWNGLKTKQGRIVYIAAEGGGGLKKRLKAISLALDVKIEMLEIGCIIEAPNFLERGDIDAIISRLKDHGPVSVVIADTLAQVTPGCDENLSGDMSVAIGNAQRIIREIETSVLLVHHAGKDESRGARGWSGLRAAMDAEFEVKSRGDVKELKVTKMKDGEEGQVFAFRLEQHEVGVDEDGLPINSCAVRYVEYVPSASPNRRLGKGQERLLLTLKELDLFNEGISRDELLDKAATTAPAPIGGKKDNRRSNLKRTLNGLIEQGHIIERDGLLFEGGG